MITLVKGDNINDTFWYLCREAVTWPKEMRRDNKTMMDSPGPVCVEIHEPKRRVLNIPHRNNSLPAACAETLWILAGRNDIDWLSFYLPRAADFSDDGEVWRAGYGPRLRRWISYGGGVNPDYSPYEHSTDQLKFVVDELRTNPPSRRAVIGIFDPYKDSIFPIKTKDFPCTQSLSFMVRNGHLDLAVFIRSNDLVWGWSGVNVFEFTVLQELVADMVGLPVGYYHHVANNLHVYDRHFRMVRRIADTGLSDNSYLYDKRWVAPKYKAISNLDYMDEELRDFFGVEKSLRDGCMADDEIGVSFQRRNGRTLIGDLVSVVLSYCAFKIGQHEVSEIIRDGIMDYALKASLDKYLAWLRRPKVPRMEDTD